MWALHIREKETVLEPCASSHTVHEDPRATAMPSGTEENTIPHVPAVSRAALLKEPCSLRNLLTREAAFISSSPLKAYLACSAV